MPNPYREIFRAPGSVGFSAAGFLARMPFSMLTIGIVTMLSQARGEYWLAGGVAATFALSNALIAPQISRLVDRHGQSKVLIPATLATIVALIGLMLATRLEAPIWVLFLFAGFAFFIEIVYHFQIACGGFYRFVVRHPAFFGVKCTHMGLRGFWIVPERRVVGLFLFRFYLYLFAVDIEISV